MPSPASNHTPPRVALAISAIVFIGIGIGIYAGARSSIADGALVAHTHEVIGRIDEIQAQVLDAESAERGYLLTGNQAYLVDYQNSVERLPLLLNQLGNKVADNPAQRSNVSTLKGLVEARLAQIKRILDLYEHNGLETARNSINRSAFRTTSAIREHVLEMVSTEQTLLAARAQSSQRSANLLLGLALAGIPFGLLLIGGAYVLLKRELGRRAAAEQSAYTANHELQESNAQLQHNAADLNQLARYTGMLQSCISAEEALEITSRVLSGLLPGVAGSVYLLRASQDRAEAISSWGDPPLQSDPQLLPEACWALRRGKPHVVNDVYHDPMCPHVHADSARPAVHACLPMSAQGVQLGFLFLTSAGSGPLPRLEIAEAAAEQLSLALSNLRLRESLRRQSIRDPLTGLYNRRYLEESLPRELGRCERRGLPLSVLMLDVDHFKQFNDSQGHAGGDALLAAVGRLLATHLRSEDIACRYGGEEFTIILPESDRDDALARADHLRELLAALVASDGERRLPSVTASIGVATFPHDGDGGPTLIRKADSALYQAKHNGRNRVERYDIAQRIPD